MQQPLESARLKIKRAHDHLRALNECSERFRETNPYPLTRKLEREGAEHVYYVEIRREPPPYLGTIIGDILHNLRSALDSVVYDLTILTRPNLSDDERKSIGFPIASEPKRFDPAQIRFLCPTAQAEVKGAQPYKTEIPALDPLWTINQLNKADKHRQVLIVPAFSMGSVYEMPEPALPFDESFHSLGPFKNGAELARFTFSEPHPEVDMKFQPMFDIALGEGREPGTFELGRAIRHVETEVLPRFERFV